MAALVLSVFFIAPISRANLNLPTTRCDSYLADPSHHLFTNISQEDGSKAFSYGTDNIHFVGSNAGVVTFNVNLFFDPQATTTIKLNFLNDQCSPSAGYAFGDFTGRANIFAYDTVNQTLAINGAAPFRIFYNSSPQYVWVEVLDQYPHATMMSYSYLVDVSNPKNPSGGNSEPPGKRPVVIIPGITGSELYDGNELIWPNVGKMFTDIGDQFLTDSLSLDSQGNSLRNITVGEIIKSLPLTHVFDNLEQSLVDKGYSINNTYYFFPYDWRLDNKLNATRLNQKIEDIKTETGFRKVDIIAHSMGGLLAKEYANQFGKDSINKLIFIGTPHLGAPKAGHVLVEGDDFSIPWLEQNRMKEIAQNSPAAYELLPNTKYFDNFSGYIEPTDSYNTLDYEGTKNVLSSLTNNDLLNTTEFFSTSLQDLDLSGIEVYNIAGCSSGTITLYKLMADNSYLIPEIYTSGDGTVPLPSSDYISTDPSHKYYVKKGVHTKLPSQSDVRNLVLSILDGDPQAGGSVSNSQNFCNFKAKRLSWYSPVTVDVYDAEGNHSGPVENGLENNIPGADYEILNGEKFIFLPTDDGQQYQIKGIGERAGSFDLRITDINNGNNLQTVVFNDVGIASGSDVNFSLSDTSTDSVISVDEENISADAILEDNSQSDQTPPVTVANITGDAGRNNWYISDTVVALSASDDSSGVMVTKYSTDNGATFMDYRSPIVVSSEGTNNLKYYSIDKAGNDEIVKNLEIKVDKTSPEILAQFDTSIQVFRFAMAENLEPLICQATTCLAEDPAGNQTMVSFENKNKKTEHEFIVKSIQYNGHLINVNSNKFKVEYKAKPDDVRDFDQVISIKDDEKVKIEYKNRKNVSVVTSKVQKEKSERKTYQGMKFLLFSTLKGNINVEIK